jgi:hypothetical protein
MKNVATVRYTGVLCGLALSGCKDEQCVQKRFDVSNQWEEVLKVAGRRALSVAESGGPADAWNKIKDQAELVHTSFATPQVTWAAAQNGRTKVRAQFKAFEDNEDARAFKRALSVAEEGHDAFEKACR